MAGHMLDHVALWVADRDELAAFLCRHVGMHEIERTETFTLVGSDARRGKLTLFEAEGPRQPGALGRVVLRVSDIDTALSELPEGLAVERPARDLAHFEGPQGLGLGLVQADAVAVEYDIDHVVLRSRDPQGTLAALAELGLAREGDALYGGDKRVLLEQGDPAAERPLLNHIALLVESGRDKIAEAERAGLEISDVRDTANTFAVFVRGPEGIEIEYVEHKPTFSLT
jgi:catechol 2,3-dioxygenase-like lactoylglutathione lyase family enzyme